MKKIILLFSFLISSAYSFGQYRASSLPQDSDIIILKQISRTPVNGVYNTLFRLDSLKAWGDRQGWGGGSGSGNQPAPIPNDSLAHSTISGIPLGSNLGNLLNGLWILGGTYNGSGAITLKFDSASASGYYVRSADTTGKFQPVGNYLRTSTTLFHSGLWLNGGDVVAGGNEAVDSAAMALYFPRRKDSIPGGYYPYSSNPLGYSTTSGTVTSISTRSPITGGTITTSGTIALNKAGIDTVGTLNSGGIGSGFTAIPNSALSNSSITINGNAVSLGGSTTITSNTTDTLKGGGVWMSSFNFNGSANVTPNVDSAAVALYLLRIKDSTDTRTGYTTLYQNSLKQNTITPAALTKTDDANVTLTLGGTPSTALLQAASITAGWTGTLADARLSTTAVTAASYGSATQSPTYTVGATGRLTAAANVLITPAFSSITSTPTTLSGYGITDAYTKTAADVRYFQISNNLSEGTAATMRTNLALGSMSLIDSTQSRDTTYSNSVSTIAAGTGISVAVTGKKVTVTNSSPSSGGTVTSVSVTTANGISGSVATATTTPAITLTLGAITPTTVNGITLSGSGSLANNSTSSLTGFTGSGTSSGTNTGDQTTVSGNAGTATALQTARTINGTSFDGTGNITVTAAAGTLTGTTLNSSVVTSSLTTIGTLVGGTVSVTNRVSDSLAVANGGTGATTAGRARTNLGLSTAAILDTTYSNGSAGTFYNSEGAIVQDSGSMSPVGWSSFSAAKTGIYTYNPRIKKLTFQFSIAGTSNSTTTTIALPASLLAAYTLDTPVRVQSAGTFSIGYAETTAGSNTLLINGAGGALSGSGNKYIGGTVIVFTQ